MDCFGGQFLVAKHSNALREQAEGTENTERTGSGLVNAVTGGISPKCLKFGDMF